MQVINMHDLSNFSNPVLAVINISLIVLFLLTLFVGYRTASLYEFYSKCKQGVNVKEEKISNKDFEPFFDAYSGTTLNQDEFISSIFNEYSREYEKQKEHTKEKEVNIKSKTESFPACYRILGFSEVPKSMKEIKDKYRKLARNLHPDAGGSEEFFIKLNKAYKEAKDTFENTCK